MATSEHSMTDQEKARFNVLNKENLEFLMDRYNRVNRWVIADMIRRTAYHFPQKTALVFGDQRLTYEQLEAAANRTANALSALGVAKYDRVAILAHNTLHHVLTWLGCCKIGAVYLAINYLLRGPDVRLLHQPLGEQGVYHRRCPLSDCGKRSGRRCRRSKTLIWSDQGSGQPPADDRFLAVRQLDGCGPK